MRAFGGVRQARRTGKTGHPATAAESEYRQALQPRRQLQTMPNRDLAARGKTRNAYNLHVVLTFISLRMRRGWRLFAGVGLAILAGIFGAVCASAQSSPAAASISSAADHGRILLVLPFDNRTGQPSLEWIREAAPDILSSRFLSGALTR